MVPDIAVKRSPAGTRFYSQEEYRTIRKRFSQLKWNLAEICDTHCEDCEFSSHRDGCKILNHFDPIKNRLTDEQRADLLKPYKEKHNEDKTR